MEDKNITGESDTTEISGANESVEEIKFAENKKESRLRQIAIIIFLAVIIVILVIAVASLFLKDNKTQNNTLAEEKNISQSDNNSSESSNNESDTDNSSSSADDDRIKDENSKTEVNTENKKEDINKETGYVVTYSVNNSWLNGDATMYGMEIQIYNGKSSAVSGWTLVLEIEELKSVDGWNGTYKIDGNKLEITDAGYNGDISSKGSTVIGCNLGAGENMKISSVTLNGEDCKVVLGEIVQNGNNNQNNSGQNNNSDNRGSSLSEEEIDELLSRDENAVQGDDWLYVKDNKIVDGDGKEVWITGVNWFGYNTGTNTFDGLWNSELVPTVKAIADHGFNLIRVPMSAQLLNQWTDGEYPQANYNNAYNADLNSMNSLEIFDYFLKLAEQNGMKVMIDIHSVETDSMGHMTNLWYTAGVTVDEYYSALEWMAERYKDNDTIIAYDLKNEPHGKPYEGDGAAIWNDSTDDNNWKYAAETAAAKILAKNPNVLIVVEGIEIYPKNIKENGDFLSTDDDDYYFNWWGGNLRGVADFPIDLGEYQNKLVYSPHDYGPAVYKQPWFDGDYDYDSLMADCWKDNWFYIYDEKIAPLLIGEWGGFMTEPNLTWMTHLRTLIKNYNLHHTFWCFNANSGDTGGLVLDDFKTWDEEKYNFVKEVLWQENGKFVGLDHEIPLGENGISLSEADGI